MESLLFNAIPNPATLKAIGNDVLIAGLVGDIAVLFIPSNRVVLEKIAGAFFIIVIIVGVWMEQVGDNRLAAPRVLSLQSQSRIAARLKPFSGTKFDMAVIPADPEAIRLIGQIAGTLKAAGWIWVEWNHPNGPFMSVYKWPGLPNVGQGGGIGIDVQVNTDHEKKLSPAARALARALESGNLAAKEEEAVSKSIPNHNTVHVIIGKRRL